MLELLIVFGLCAIGIFFTTTTNEPELEGGSRWRDDVEDGDGGGIGILGIDIARKVRRARSAVAKSMPTEAVGLSDRKPRRRKAASAGTVEHVPADARFGDRSAAADEESFKAAVRAAVGSAPAVSDAHEDFPDRAMIAAGAVGDDRLDQLDRLRSDFRPVGYADMDGLAGPDSFQFDDRLDGFEHDLGGFGAPAARAAMPHADDARRADDGLDDDLEGVLPQAEASHRELAAELDDDDLDDDLDAELADEDDDADDLSLRMPAAAAAAAPDGPPVIEDFNPTEDQIMIGYRPGEAGDGRIGISEDPKHPGTARVTLGGRVVALVPGGFGLVRAHHIELFQMDEAA